jgi:hypothetical protein
VYEWDSSIHLKALEKVDERSEEHIWNHLDYVLIVGGEGSSMLPTVKPITWIHLIAQAAMEVVRIRIGKKTIFYKGIIALS